MTMSREALREFALRYTAAWSSQDAASVALFYTEDGSLSINDGEPAVGRVAITATAQEFMSAFPNLSISMDELIVEEHRTKYLWTLTGKNTGPGGTWMEVCISGYEVWRLNEDGLIAEAKGHFDVEEYERQLDR